MSQTATSDLASVSDMDMVIDSDAHILESLEQILPYMEDEVSKKFISETSNPQAMIYSVALTGPFPQSYYGTGQNPYEFEGDLEAKKLSEQDDFDINYGILGPTLNLALPTVNNDRFAAAIAGAYNRFVLNKFVDETDRVVPTMIVPGQVPERAAKQIDRWGAEFEAVHMTPSGLRPPCGYEKYDPIYEAAADQDLPIIMHAGATNYTFPIQFAYSQTHAQSMITNFAASLQWHLTSLIYNGAVERHSDIDFVFQEAGIGWIPYTRYRLDDYYLAEGEYLPWVDKPPREYLDDQFYFSTQPLGHTADRPQSIADFIEMAGPENIMFSTDLPHSDFDTPEELFDRIQGRLSDDEVRNVMGGNAARVFGLG